MDTNGSPLHKGGASTRETASFASGIAVLLCALALAAAQPAIATEYWVFMDDSQSVTTAQRQRWAHDLVDELLPKLHLGDSILIWGLHARTPDAAPLLISRTQTLPRDPTLTESERGRRDLERMRRQAAETIGRALAGPGVSPWTDVLGALDLVPPRSQGESAVLILATDGYHAVPSLDTETLRLTEAVVKRLVDSVLCEYAWDTSRFARMEIHFLLPDAGAEPLGGLNARRDLRNFYCAILARTGGQLASWATYLSLGGAQ